MPSFNPEDPCEIKQEQGDREEELALEASEQTTRLKEELRLQAMDVLKETKDEELLDECVKQLLARRKERIEKKKIEL